MIELCDTKCHALMRLDEIGKFAYNINLIEWTDYLSDYGKSLIKNELLLFEKLSENQYASCQIIHISYITIYKTNKRLVARPKKSSYNLIELLRS
jgi:hypothetical protein